ncbi:WXG100 family type VII secretion target [Nocardia asteroides]|uniref:WXG100 family type VII secretion target n=1 Tax=Nocardia asteroides TaxID=1824 RepID=UPI001E28B512|nr:WXG100 family type VII secretion target [Nocardia asteroides]UGT60035.1 WXG100 family type VII secretion target [Nocardia asteroides]
MDIYYNRAKIEQTIADLQKAAQDLQSQDQGIRDASSKLAGAWESGAASTFQEVQNRWNNEFVDTQDAMTQLIKATQQALAAAIATDGKNASMILG